jgi:hypothetical protein
VIKRSQLVQHLRSAEEKYLKFASKSDCVHCGNCFDHDDKYQSELGILTQIESSSEQKTTKGKGDLLEELLESLFRRFDTVEPFSRNTCDTGIGQIDLLVTVIADEFYDVLGLFKKPKGIIGECKNYDSSGSLGRPIIEQMCWRSVKGSVLVFVVAKKFSKDSQKEIGDFNNLAPKIVKDFPDDAILVPITLEMISVVLKEDLNFCYFLKWAIQATKHNMAISNYLGIDE